MNVISVSNLSFKYPSSDEDVIKNISFDIKEGTFVSILGSNGCGKSTLARLLIGLLKKKEGTITIFGTELNEKTVYGLRSKIGIVFQNPDNQFIGATVEDDIAFGLENRQKGREEMRDIVFKCADDLGLLKLLNKEPSNLSGGQKQRVAIASVLALSPDILIMDEATSMLDPKHKKEIFDILKSIRKSNPKLTIFSITHNVEETCLSDEIIVIDKGMIAYQGTPNNLYNNDELLVKYQLNKPFIYSLMSGLNENGFNIKESDSIEEVVNKICQ